MNNNYCGFWKRLFAFVVDYIVSFFIGGAIGFVIGFLIGFYSNFFEIKLPSNLFIIFFNVLGLLVTWLYYALFESSKYQATPGKMVIGAKVTDLEGNKISFRRATVRFWSKIISALILLIGFFMIGFTQKKQGLHDFIAQTLVLEKN